MACGRETHSLPSTLWIFNIRVFGDAKVAYSLVAYVHTFDGFSITTYKQVFETLDEARDYQAKYTDIKYAVNVIDDEGVIALYHVEEPCTNT